MRPVSEAFKAAIKASHPLAVKVEVLRAGTVVRTLTSVGGGTVTLDAGAAVRGHCDLTIIDDGTMGLAPRVVSDLLAPYGNELRVYRGLYHPDGQSEVVSLGVFRIDSADIEDTPQGLGITIAGQDRAARIVDARFEAPYTIASGTNVVTAIQDTLTAAYPSLVASFPTTAETTPLLVAEEGADRWQFCTDLAKSIGMRLFFDGDGTAVLAPETTSTGPSVELAEGEDGVLLSVGSRWNREGTFNRVIATGENTGEVAPVRGVATDDNPASPTYYFGPFGQVPRFYQSAFLRTVAQCESAAQAILQRELGTTQRISFGSLVLPYLEPGDVAQITRARSGVDQAFIIDALTIPLVATEGMTGSTRALV